jgi:hypothetical protein
MGFLTVVLLVLLSPLISLLHLTGTNTQLRARLIFTNPCRFHAFTSRLNSRVRLVGAYLHCTSTKNPGGHGPRIEGHSFFTDLEGLKLLQQKNIIRSMVDKVDA